MTTPQTIYASPPRTAASGGPAAGNDYRSIAAGIELVWVQCKGYRCMAYADAAGRWINFYTGSVVNDVVGVIR